MLVEITNRYFKTAANHMIVNVTNFFYSVVNRDCIILHLLHIQLGLMKQFVKAFDKDGDCYNIAKTFPGLSMEKLKAGIFDGPQIRKLMQDRG